MSPPRRGCGKWEAEVAREHRDALVDLVQRGRGDAEQALAVVGERQRAAMR